MQELYSHRNSLLHEYDARAKLLFTLAMIVFLNLTPAGAWPAYILFLAVALSLAVVSRLGIGFVLKRALLAAPFVLAAIPLIFRGAPPLIPVHLIPGVQISYSPEGVERFASIAVKSWISVQAAIILAATSRFADLLTALQQLKTPRIFAAIIGLMWRYLFVIGDEVTRMLRARSSRSATAGDGRRAGGSLFWRGRVTGRMAGSLFLRSIERSDRVYAAMLSRGYSGELPASEAEPLPKREKQALFAGILLLAGLWALGIFTGGQF